MVNCIWQLNDRGAVAKSHMCVKGSRPVAYVKGAAAEEGRGENPSGRANKICLTVAKAESYGLIVNSLAFPRGSDWISCVDTADRLAVVFFVSS